MPPDIHWTIPVEAHWESENPFENTNETEHALEHATGNPRRPPRCPISGVRSSAHMIVRITVLTVLLYRYDVNHTVVSFLVISITGLY